MRANPLIRTTPLPSSQKALLTRKCTTAGSKIRWIVHTKSYIPCNGHLKERLQLFSRPARVLS